MQSFLKARIQETSWTYGFACSCSTKMNGRHIGSVTLKMRLYNLCRGPCFCLCSHPQCQAEATCQRDYSFLLMLCLPPFLILKSGAHPLPWTGFFTHRVDYTVAFRQKQIHLLGEKSDRIVNYSLFCSTLRVSIVLSNIVQSFQNPRELKFFLIFLCKKQNAKLCYFQHRIVGKDIFSFHLLVQSKAFLQ